MGAGLIRESWRRTAELTLSSTAASLLPHIAVEQVPDFLHRLLHRPTVEAKATWALAVSYVRQTQASRAFPRC